nr:restriction endonuclease subunit S [Variovorax sp. dw_954]
MPAGWTSSTLGSVAAVNPSRKTPESESEMVSFLAMGDISEDGHVQTKQVRTYEEVATGFTSFTDGDVLVAKITPCFENGKGALVAGLLGGLGYGSTEFHVLRANSAVVTPAFIYWVTRTDAFRLEGERNMLGSAGQKRVPTDFLRRYPIKVPTIREQHEIAALLKAVDNKLVLIARQIEATQTLRQGLTQSLFERGVGTQDAAGGWTPHAQFSKRGSGARPSTWQFLRMGDIAPVIRREVDVQTSESYPELGLRSFGKGTFHKPALNGKEVGSKRLFVIKAGDLLLSNVFAWEGAIAVAGPVDHGRYGSHRYITCNVDPGMANVHFIARYLVTPAGLTSVGLASPGGAGRNKTLGLSALADIRVPVPPLAEQNAINEVLTCVETKIAALQTKHRHYKAVKRGLMQKLLTGEWRVMFDAEIAA